MSTTMWVNPSIPQSSVNSSMPFHCLSCRMIMRKAERKGGMAYGLSSSVKRGMYENVSSFSLICRAPACWYGT